jgi:poly(3-hydroxyalkanoate) synthetase
MQSVADQIQRQQQAFQQMLQESMNTYMQLLNTPPFSLSGPSEEGQQATQQTFQQASQQWMQLAQQQQEMFQRMSQQWMEQAQQQQQAFQRMVQESLTAYTDLFTRSG